MISALVLGLASLSLGVAHAWLSSSAGLHHTISAASSFGETSDEVWVCKLVGSTDDLRLAEGKNPIHVSVLSIDAQQGFSDNHPSYLVKDGESVCHVPDSDGSESSNIEEGNARSGPVTTGDVTESNPLQPEESQDQSGTLTESGGDPADESGSSEGPALTSPTVP